MARRKDVNQFLNLRGGYAGENNPGGAVYWVGASGYAAYDGASPSDSNDGLSPQEPFATIQKGLDSCVTGRGDTVAILPGTITITAALTMTKANVTLKGALPVSPHQRSPAIIACATDVNMIQVAADFCTIEGITFDNNIATATADTELIQVCDSATTQTRTGTVIRNCFFDNEGGDSDMDVIRVGFDADSIAPQTVIEGCTLHDVDQKGIVITADSDECIIRNCRIYDEVTANVMTDGINSSSDNVLIEGNYIMTDDGTACVSVAAGTEVQISGNMLWANGANTIGILAADGVEFGSMNNWIAAGAAGNVIDHTADVDGSSASADVEAVTAANPAQAAFTTPTVDGT